MAKRAAGFQHIKILGLKPRMAVLEDIVERVHQTIAEGIGIDVKRRVQKMRDISPEGAVFVIETKSRTKTFALHLHPNFAEALGAEFALRALTMDAFFKLMKGDLADDGVHHVLDLTGQQDTAARWLGLGLEHGLEGQHFAEHRSRFRQGQGGIGHQRALTGRQHLMHPMT